MPGWTSRLFSPTPPFFLPQGMYTPEHEKEGRLSRLLPPLFCLVLTFILATGLRLLEIPFWDNLAYRLGDEYLLATHDAYHWISGAEGFGRATHHPMASLARFLSWLTGQSPAVACFWAPPFLCGFLAVSIFLWGWGLGRPFAGIAAGILAPLAPAFCARTLLGFYDTDLVIVTFAVLLGLAPALWISPWLASLPEILVGIFLRRRHKKNRTVPGASHTDMPERHAAPLSGNPGSLRCHWFYGKRAAKPGVFLFSRSEVDHSILSWPWLLLLIASGLFGHAMQDWHSLFPYLVRYSALVPPLIILAAGPRGARSTLLAGALCHSLPLLLGWPGVVAALLYASALMVCRYQPDDGPGDPPASPDHAHLIKPGPPESLCWRLSPLSFEFRRFLIRGWPTLLLLWGLVVYLAFDAGVFEAMKRSFTAYVMRGGDISSMPTAAADPVIYPSVSLSIIEVQTISLESLFTYIYPLKIVAFASFAIFAVRLLFTPVFIWFLPLLALALLSLKMGARMTLFAPPMLMLALCMEGGMLLEFLFRSLRPAAGGSTGEADDATQAPVAKRQAPPWCKTLGAFSLRLAVCLLLTVALAIPLTKHLPYYALGPIISQEQAEGLSYLKTYSPKDSTVWNWWDWGYATHHFSHRNTIADGARHGGPSLFLPAAVYTTADPRFARQIIKYTATKGNEPGNVFAGLSAGEAQQLMRDLGNPNRPLINAPGKQYLVVSFELLRLGVWVTRYGSWNFETRESSGSLMNNLSAGLTFNLDTGIILPQGSGDSQPIYAASINLLEKHNFERTEYNRYGAYHFLFNTQYLEYAQRKGPLHDFLNEVWNVLRPDYVFPVFKSDKIVMDEVFFNTMMVQLLLCPKDDPLISPYFKRVFDNRYTRVYEVL